MLKGTTSRLLVGVLSLLPIGMLLAAETAPVQERMSPLELHATGLDKLSPDELKALNEWLRTHAHTTTTYVTPEGKPVFFTKGEEKVPVESKIAGTFTGWYGKSSFKLENGQEWTQAESGQMNFGKFDHPQVKIKPMMMGAWLMYVEPCGCSVRVERTK